jgi:outer membrane protein TolC
MASFWLALGALAALAAPPPPGQLTLEDCLRLAEAAPSPLAVAARQRQIAQARYDAAVAGLLPRLAVSAGYTRNSPLPGAPDTGSFVSLNGVNQYTALVSATEEVDLSGRVRAGRVRARADQDAAELTYHLNRRDLHHAVALAYYRVLLTRRLVTVAADILGEAQRFAARTELLAKKGEAARADIVRATSQVEILRQARQAADVEAALASQELAAFWTDDVTVPLALFDPLDQAPPPPAAAPPPRPRPELALLEAQRRGLEAEARGARAARYPQGNVMAEYGLDSNRLDWRDRGYAVIVGLTIPLFDWSAAANTARQLSLQAEQLSVESQLSRRLYAREYASAELRVRALFEQIATTREQVRLSQENLDLSRIRYEGGEGSALEVVSAQTQLAQARGTYYQVRVAHLTARADLAIAAGRELADSGKNTGAK